MKKGLLTLAVCTLVLSVNGQWDWGGSSSGSGGTGSTGSTGTGSGSTGGATTGATPPATPAAAPTLAVPTIGTHYDDPPTAHKELPQTVNDGRPGIDDASVVSYPYLRQADVKFKRRVWRRIDTRQKMNKSFTWPKNPVTQVIYEAGVKGLVKAYWSDSLEGGRTMTPEDAYKQGSVLQTPQIQNWRNPADPTDLVDTAYYDIFKWEKIVRLR